MSQLSRRQLLTFFGATAAATALGPALGRVLGSGAGRVAANGGGWPTPFTPVRLPYPLPIYTTHPNYLAKPDGTGDVLPPTPSPSLLEYTVVDDVVLPPEYEYYAIVKWGERVFSDPNQYVGYNCDYTAYIPLRGVEDGILFVNHEYVSFPFGHLAPEMPADLASAPTSFEAVIGFPVHAVKNRGALGEMLYIGWCLLDRRGQPQRRGFNLSLAAPGAGG